MRDGILFSLPTMTDKRTVKIGILGAGMIGKVHARHFGEAEGAEVVAIADAFPAAAQNAAAQFGIPKVHEKPDDLLADPDIEAVVLGVPNKLHDVCAIQAMDAGKHVLVEKPMGITAEAAKNIVRKQQETGKVVMVAHQMRWGPVPQAIKQQADDGAFGRIYYAKTGWFRRKAIPGWGSWFTRMDEAGGGPMIDIGVHMLDMALYFMGNPKPVSVFGATYAEFGPKKRGIGTWGTPQWDGVFDVEDLATAMIRMEDGSMLTLEVSWAVNNAPEDSAGFVRLMGDKAGACFKTGQNGTFYTEQFDRPVDVDVQPNRNAPDERSLLSAHFVECVRDGKQPISDAMSGLTNNLIIEGIYESSRTGHEVALDFSL